MKFFLSLISIIIFSSCNPEKRIQRYASLLPGKWELEKLNGQSVDKGDQALPYIEFKPGERFLVGNAGCNSIRGIFTIDGPKLVMNDILSTRMACPRLELETQLINAISVQTLSYKVEPDDELVIYGGNTKLEFKRAK